MNKHIGYTSEQFDVSEGRIFKYTVDPNRIEFLKTQMNHLQSIGEKYPGSVPADIRWEDRPIDGKYGYSMEYIEDAQRLSDSHLSKVIILIDHCSNLWPQTQTPLFCTFVAYIQSVIDKGGINIYDEADMFFFEREYIPSLERMANYFNEERGSCHGDFTMENILVSDTRLVMIDPIRKTEMWSSWLQDVAKFYQNIYFYDVPKTLLFTEKIDFIAAGKTTPVYKMVYLLMISNYIRMFPYIKNDKALFDKRYAEFKTLINTPV